MYATDRQTSDAHHRLMPLRYMRRGIITNGDTIYYAALLPRRGPHIASHSVCPSVRPSRACYPRRARSALGVDIVLTLDVCLYVSALERKRLIGMT